MESSQLNKNMSLEHRHPRRKIRRVPELTQRDLEERGEAQKLNEWIGQEDTSRIVEPGHQITIVREEEGEQDDTHTS